MGPVAIVHGHFYQPPRENPWTGDVERQASAAPFRDWNERVFTESYRSNACARILDGEGRVVRIVDNYAHLSFNFGPTLLSWMQRTHPITYGRIIRADRESVRARGHGNALAQAFGHTILPLDDPRDARTQIRWGLSDFSRRFERRAEGMWLPETAVNDDVMGILAEEGVGFTVLSPQQAQGWRPLGTPGWRTEPVDTRQPHRWIHPDGSGRFVDVFFFDPGRSKAVAFGGASNTSQAFADLMDVHERGVSIIATDGETYGHHAVFGDRTLAHVFEVEGPRRGIRFTNFAAYLREHPPAREVQLALGERGLGTSWSCVHGVGRWARDCGCSTGGGPGEHQRWRAPLRTALAELRTQLHRSYEEQAIDLLADPWSCRDAYVEAMDLGPEPFATWLEPHARRRLDGEAQIRVRTLLEMERYALLMMTSCAWFFHDVSGIETARVLAYAGRAIDYARDLGREDLEGPFVAALEDAQGYLQQSAAQVYGSTLARERVTPSRAAAQLSIHALTEAPAHSGRFGGFAFTTEQFRKHHSGPFGLVTAWITLRDVRSGREHRVGAGALQAGGLDFYAAIAPSMGAERYARASDALFRALERSSLPVLVRTMHALFGPEEHQLQDLLPAGLELLAGRVFKELVGTFVDSYADLWDRHGRTLGMLRSAGFEIPKELAAAAEFTLQRRLEEEIEALERSDDPTAYLSAAKVAEEIDATGFSVDRATATQYFENMLNRAVRQAILTEGREGVEAVADLLGLINDLALPVSLDRAQEALLGVDGPLPVASVRDALMGPLRVAEQAFDRRY